MGRVPRVPPPAHSHQPDPEEVLWAEIEFPDGGRDACVDRTAATSSGYAYRPKLTFRQQPAVEGYHYLATGADDAGHNTVTERDNEGNAYVEMLFPYEYAKLILDAPPPEDACARLRVYVAHGKKAVIDRDTDLLTAEEYTTHSKQIAASVLEELRIWIAHKCFTRRPRKGARNILDVK